MKNLAHKIVDRASSAWWKIANRTPKVFCVSMQRTGTTSVGQFFQDFGFKRAGWPACRRNNWREFWYEGDYESIFCSPDFRSSNAFEDSPWFYPGFYRVLYHRFPRSQFVLMERDPDDWWRSMKSHSGGNILGLNRIHSKIYRREADFFGLLDDEVITDQIWNSVRDDKKMSLGEKPNQYKKIYNIHNKEVKEFFEKRKPSALHIGDIEDKDKWIKLGKFLNVDVPNKYESHKNRS